MPSPHSRTIECEKHSTATEHATGAATQHITRALLQSTATEHARRLDAIAINDAQADRANNSMDHLVFGLARFLTCILQDLWTAPGFRRATEQARSSADNDSEDIDSADDCIDIVFNTIAEWSQQASVHFYKEPELLLHKRMWDILTRDKSGRPKEQSFTDWCRRVASHSKKTSTATEHAAAESSATEHAESSASFQSLAQDMLTNDLTEDQKQNPVYKLRKDTAVTTRQRSWINMMLRKNLGDSKVCYFIFNHGVPLLLDLPLRFKGKINKALLQNMLEEFMTWHASLLQSILEHQDHPDMTTARRLSDLDQKQWQQRRRQTKLEAKQQVQRGTFLAEQRDNGKRKFEDMSAAEQQLLEDFETQKSSKQYEEARVKRPRYFHGKML